MKIRIECLNIRHNNLRSLIILATLTYAHIDIVCRVYVSILIVQISMLLFPISMRLGEELPSMKHGSRYTSYPATFRSSFISWCVWNEKSINVERRPKLQILIKVGLRKLGLIFYSSHFMHVIWWIDCEACDRWSYWRWMYSSMPFVISQRWPHFMDSDENGNHRKYHRPHNPWRDWISDFMWFAISQRDDCKWHL